MKVFLLILVALGFSLACSFDDGADVVGLGLYWNPIPQTAEYCIGLSNCNTTILQINQLEGVYYVGISLRCN
jgi:hypothetical protein